MGNRFRVFVSSSIDEYAGHRDILLAELNSIPIVSAYVFEAAPAQPAAILQDFVDGYLNRLRESDLLVVILGKEVRPAVSAEIDLALSLEMPILLFIEERYRDTIHVELITAKVIGKYQTFVKAKELATKVTEAVSEYLVDAAKYYWRHRSH